MLTCSIHMCATVLYNIPFPSMMLKHTAVIMCPLSSVQIHTGITECHKTTVATSLSSLLQNRKRCSRVSGLFRVIGAKVKGYRGWVKVRG